MRAIFVLYKACYEDGIRTGYLLRLLWPYVLCPVLRGGRFDLQLSATNNIKRRAAK